MARFFIYALLLISQLDSRLSPTLPHLLTWILGFVGETLLLAVGIIDYEKALQAKPPKKRHIKWGSWEIADLSIDVLRALLLLVLIGTYIALVIAPPPPAARRRGSPDETAGLLASPSNPASDGEADYGAVPPAAARAKHANHGLATTTTAAGWGRRTVVSKQSWWEYLRGYAIFFPYLWPSKDRRLQILMVLCFILVMLQRGVNVLVPNQLGIVTDILSGEDGEGLSVHPPLHSLPIMLTSKCVARLPWGQIFLYIFYRFLQGNMGVLGALRSALWIPIGQYSYQALSTSAFEHVHSLSLDFHLGKKTGEVLSALSKGNAINNFLEQVSFQVVPMLVDLAVAVAYFLIKFDA